MFTTDRRFWAGFALVAALGVYSCKSATGTDDAGVPDAGLDAKVDAGPQDAGTDAGADDGAMDAGGDFSPEDAGTDAGDDAGTEDAGQIDAGGDLSPDAGADADAGDGDATDGEFCIDGWCWQRPQFFGVTLYGVWGSAPDDVWAVGVAGTIVHFDGQNWRQVPSGIATDLHGVWGSAPDDVWAVGAQGVLLYFNGSDWSPAESPTTKTLNGVYGTASDDVYAVGDEDTRLQWDGLTWTELPTLFPDMEFKPHQYGVWADAGGEVWCAGSPRSGSILHRTAGVWTQTEVDYYSGTNTFRAVWGSGPEDVWLAARPGSHGRLQRWDGQEWQIVSPPAEVYFTDTNAITGSGPDDVWFFGEWYGSAHFNGETFVLVPELEPEYLTGGWVHPSGAGWTVGYAGRIGRKTEIHGQWTFVSGSPSGGWDTLSTVRTVGENQAWAVGRLSMVRWDGTQWTDVDPAPTTYRQEFTDVWGAAPDDVWAVAWGSWAPDQLQHFDGDAWSTVDHPGGPAYLNAVWGSAADDVWIAAENGPAMHWAGSEWQEAETSPGSALALHGTASDDIWSVGRDGFIRHFDGNQWTAKTSGTEEHLNAVLAFSPTDAWAAGANATLLRWDGAIWAPAPSVPPLVADETGRRSITGLAGTGPQDLWLCTIAGEVYHYDGGNWTRSTRLPVGLTGLARNPAGIMFTVGRNGAILQHTP